MMQTSNKQTFFQNLFTKYKIRVKQRPEILVGFVENLIFFLFLRKNSIFTIQPDIRYPAKLLAGYPAAGYSAKSVSGTTLLLIQPQPLKGQQGYIKKNFPFLFFFFLNIHPCLAKIYAKLCQFLCVCLPLTSKLISLVYNRYDSTDTRMSAVSSGQSL